MKQAVILDVDGVLLNWFDGFTHWMAAQGHRTVHGIEHTKFYDMTGNFPDLTVDQIDAEIARFNVSPAFAELPEWPGAMMGVRDLRKIFPDYPVVALTAAGSHPTTVSYRAEAVKRFDLDGIHITPLGMSKRFFLEHYAPGSIFVEDNIKHATTGYHAGHQAILMDRPYNRVDDVTKEMGLHRVHEWKGVIDKCHQISRLKGAKETIGA